MIKLNMGTILPVTSDLVQLTIRVKHKLAKRHCGYEIYSSKENFFQHIRSNFM